VGPAKFMERVTFRRLAVHGRLGSGRRWREVPDAKYLIDGKDGHAEHKMAFHLDRAAHAHEPA
jgi:hypothetical protein